MSFPAKASIVSSYGSQRFHLCLMRRPNARSINPTSDEGKVMDPIKLHSRPARPGLRSTNGKHLMVNQRSRFWLITSIFMGLALFCYIAFFRTKSEGTEKYGVVIDGGSTGTRIHVFKYEVRNGNFGLDFTEKGLVSMRVNPGLSTHVDDPDGAGHAMDELVQFAKGIVPSDQWRSTEIRLMATAGMRLLVNEDQDRVLKACRRVLKASGFRFRDDWATVILGSDEGLYAWVVANYALGTLGAEPALTTGIIELGGASAQITFVSDEPVPPEFSRKIKFGNFTYNLYSHSLLQFGQNVAFELFKESLVLDGQELVMESLQSKKPMDPCTPRGYVPSGDRWKLSPASIFEKHKHLSTLHPSGNFSECRSASLKLLQKDRDKCSYKTCYIGSTFIPKLQGKFLATENFFYTSKFFRLGENASLSDLVVAGHEFCGEDWSKLTQKYNSLEEEDLVRYCFSSAYIVALLHDSLGIDMNDQRIVYANQVHNIPLDWALGAFILQSSENLDSSNSDLMASIARGDFSKSRLVFGILLLLALVSWFILRRRKPQLKTIYDVEKGKYIVKHIGRYS